MVFTQVYWSGFCSLENFCFNNAQIIEYQENELADFIRNNWLKFIKTYPESYDGKLLFLNSFEQEQELCEEENCHLFFNISFIRYSTLVGLQHLQKPVQFYGVVGTQIAIFDELEQFILVGKRKFNQYYAPGLLTLPGGMLELEDAYNPKKSLLRELEEEIEIKIKNPLVMALISDHTKYSAIILIQATINQQFDKNHVFIEKENEFEKNQLFWLDKNQLKKIDSAKLMEGLTYFKNQLG